VTARRWFALALVLAIVAAALVMRTRPARVLVDLTGALPSAKQQPPTAFSVQPVTIDGTTQSSIVARDQTRLTFHVTLPVHAALEISEAIDPSVWNEPGDGVLLLVGVSDGRTYRTLDAVTLAPHDRPDDRHWRRLTFSLEEFAGLTVDVVLNTRAGAAPGATTRGDVAVWGAPRVVAR